MADPIGVVPVREFDPGLHLLVYDSGTPGNQQVDKVPMDAQTGERIAEALDLALETSQWRVGGSVDLTGYATEAYVDAQFDALTIALDAIMNP